MSFFLLVVQDRSVPTRSLLIWLGVLGALIITGLVVVLQLKKRFREDDSSPEKVGFTLSDLRTMHRDGELSDEEFEKAKAQVMLAAKRVAERPPGEDNLAAGSDLRAEIARRSQNTGGAMGGDAPDADEEEDGEFLRGDAPDDETDDDTPPRGLAGNR